MRRRLTLLGTTLLFSTTVMLATGGCTDTETGAGATCAEWHRSLAMALESGRDKAGAAGAVMAVRSDECGSWEAAAARAGSRPPTATGLVRIGSITKTYVAALILLLSADGALDLDRPAATYTRELEPTSPVTVRQLLNHTSGVPEYADLSLLDGGVAPDRTKEIAPADLVRHALTRGTSTQPGTRWRYANTNYILLGLIAEAAGKQPLAAQIRSRLLAPRHLDATFLDGDEVVPASLERGYSSDGRDVTEALHPSFTWASGGMVATMADTARWIEALASGRVVEGERLRAMLEEVPTSTEGLGYGLGVMVFSPSIALARGIGHRGDLEGYHCYAIHFPEKRATVAHCLTSDASSDVAMADVLLTLLGR